MKLVIFDIDGTLIDSAKVDGDCFAAALYHELDVTLPDRDWSRFPHTTDAGIFTEIFCRSRGRPPRPEEIRAFIDRFLDLLKKAHKEDPLAFNEIPGAGAALYRIQSSGDSAVALATGGFRDSAIFKLKCAGLDISGPPLATSNDAPSREEILSVCLKRARTCYSVKKFDKLISVGDGPWDVRAARTMGYAFIGLGDPAPFQELGARDTIEDFTDIDRFIRLLDRAEVPADI